MALVAMGVFFVVWASFGLPTPAWQSPAIVWLAGIIWIGLGLVDLGLERRRR